VVVVVFAIVFAIVVVFAIAIVVGIAIVVVVGIAIVVAFEVAMNRHKGDLNSLQIETKMSTDEEIAFEVGYREVDADTWEVVLRTTHEHGEFASILVNGKLTDERRERIVRALLVLVIEAASEDGYGNFRLAIVDSAGKRGQG
jgi:hypothetical protein